MLGVKEAIIVCRFSSLYKELRDAVKLQRKHCVDKLSAISTSIILCMGLAWLGTYLIFYFNPDVIKTEDTTSTIIIKLVITFSLLTIIALFLVPSLIEEVFHIDRSKTALDGMANLSKIANNINEFQEMTDSSKQTEDVLFEFLCKTGVMQYLCSNWDVLCALKQHDCVVFFNAAKATASVYDKESEEEFTVQLETSFVKQDLDKDDLVLLVSPNSARIRSNYINTLHTKVRQCGSEEEI